MDLWIHKETKYLATFSEHQTTVAGVKGAQMEQIYLFAEKVIWVMNKVVCVCRFFSPSKNPKQRSQAFWLQNAALMGMLS